ncbi:2-hydroxy-3-oxopropionate reductase [Eisenbergiella tayi]|uniref:2-hydroxy-3-oxopropionate reductase n=1 Tax=Eisenbergiella tayi TaxID=1432052 RepID=UPI0008493563|nr:2-hydroxy-3-oxopropionate reductase [Eisenbergiella tayi]ODR28399.1 2-hydroxy-3-oxopropionate reductase [Eisenbergiella tayi]
MNIGFIGLGIMGKPMCKNLVKAGHRCTVYDIMEAAMDEAAAAGAIKSRSAAEAAAGKELVITMLPNSPHVRQVVMGENGIMNHMGEGCILVDMSSIAPLASKEIGAALSDKNIEMLDAPVSGGEPKAIDGTLSIMVGGKKEIYDRVKDVLLCMGSSAVYCGEIGAGNTTKLANQIVVALNIAACGEAFTLSKKAGVDPGLVFAAIRGGLAGSVVMDAKVPMMLQGNDKPGFTIDLHIKDLNNALDTGHGVGMGLPLTAQVMEMMQQLAGEGLGGKDHSALVKYYEKMTGESLNVNGKPAQ